MAHDVAVDGSGIERPIQFLYRAVVSDGPEQRPGTVGGVAGETEVILDQPLGRRVDGHEADLVALAVDAQMPDAFPAFQVPDAEAAEFLAPDPRGTGASPGLFWERGG